MRKFPLLLVALVLSVSMSLSAQEQQSLYHRGNGSFVYKETDKVYNWPFSVKNSPMATNEYLEKAFARRLYVHIGKLDTANSGGGISKLQGEHRLARGRNFYKTAKRVARKNHWDFNWEKVEVKNVGHSGWGMVYGLKHNKISEYSEDEYLKTSAYYLIYKKGANSKKIAK